MSIRFAPGVTPYCGAAPLPGGLFYRWNLDLLAITILFAFLAVYAAARASRTPSGPHWRSAAFVAGWGVGLLTLISPLCALSVALFSARVTEHMILTCISAPLVALGRPGGHFEFLLKRLSGGRLVVGFPRLRPLLAAGLFAVALWFWHSPGPYAATFTSQPVFWAMQVTLYGSALWFWSGLFAASNNMAEELLAVLITTGQMGLLGAIITFAPRAVYAPHLIAPFAWGLTPLQDQQLGGVVMWVPAGAILALALVFNFTAMMRRADLRGPAIVAEAR